MYRFQPNRVRARKILLDRKDIIAFRNVPDFIVDAFFGDCTYVKRLIVSTFSFLNGLSLYQLMTLPFWKDFTDVDKNKIEALYRDLQRPAYQQKYYSYNVHYGLVMFLNGAVRKKSMKFKIK